MSIDSTNILPVSETTSFFLEEKNDAEERTTMVGRQIHEIQSHYPQRESSGEMGAAFSERFKLLPKEDLDSVSAHCIKDYQKAVEEYEIEAASMCLEDDQALAFAQEMCRRMAAVVNAYVEITEPSLSDFDKELRGVQILAEILGNESESTGSVGFNPLSIKNTLKKGNLREKMTLVYVFGRFFTQNVLKNSDKDMVRKINERLRSHGEGFQLDTNMMAKDNALEEGIPYSTRILTFRDGGKGRPNRPPKDRQDYAVTARNISGLSLRELRVGLKDYDITQAEFDAMKQGRNEKLAQRMLKWKAGMDYCIVNPTTPFAQETARLGLPASSLICGPSGTTDSLVMRLSHYLGLDDLEGGTRAAIGWMVPAQDHSLHEVLLAASDWGVSYKGEPEDFDAGFGLKGFSDAMEERLQKKGLQMPGYYLTEAHQRQVQRSYH